MVGRRLRRLRKSTLYSLLLLLGAVWPLSAQNPDPKLPPENPIEQPVLPPGDLPQAVNPALTAAYVIGPEDLLDIEVFNVPELGRTVRVANDGTVSLPLLGRVEAVGRTTDQFGRELEAKLSEDYLQAPQVSIFVREYHARPVSVIGAVDRPGLYQLTAARTLVEMISMAGGLAKRMSTPAGRTVLITRKEGFPGVQLVPGMRLLSPEKLEINLHELLYSQQDALNIEIKPLDIISVSQADVVYVTGGGVKQAGGFVLEDRESVTVLQAIAMAQGLSGSAARADARIIRRKPDGSRDEIPVNLKKVLKGKSPDPEMQANDILFVPDSAEKIALKRGVEAAVATVSGVLIWRTR